MIVRGQFPGPYNRKSAPTATIRLGEGSFLLHQEVLTHFSNPFSPRASRQHYPQAKALSALLAKLRIGAGEKGNRQ